MRVFLLTAAFVVSSTLSAAWADTGSQNGVSSYVNINRGATSFNCCSASAGIGRSAYNTVAVQDAIKATTAPAADPLAADIAKIVSEASGAEDGARQASRFLSDLTRGAEEKCQDDTARDGEEDSFGSTACIASVHMASEDWQLREEQHATVVAIELQRLRIAKAEAETVAAKAEQTAHEAELANMNAAAALTTQGDLAALRTFTAELIAEAVANCTNAEPHPTICDEPSTHLGIAAASTDGSIDWQLIAVDDQ